MERLKPQHLVNARLYNTEEARVGWTERSEVQHGFISQPVGVHSRSLQPTMVTTTGYNDFRRSRRASFER